MLPERLARFAGDLTTTDASARWLNETAASITHEARATKCEHISFKDALLVLTFERWERGILSIDERDRLLRRLYT
jgi:hypothetical protein